MAKIELLKTPEERQRRMHEIREVRADPRMDPSYGSDDDSGESEAKKQGWLQPYCILKSTCCTPLPPKKKKSKKNACDALLHTCVFFPTLLVGFQLQHLPLKYMIFFPFLLDINLFLKNWIFL